MLTHISISHLITISELNLDLHAGMTVITGETGAGKSILMDAIELALGGRATTDIVRPHQEKADIHLCFDLSKLPEARAWLKHYDLEQDTHECVIRRTINRDGRTRSYINGMPTTLQPLREFSELLLQIHGQHEHQSLLKSDQQRDLLDRYAGHMQLVDRVHALADDWHTIKQEINTLRQLSHDHHARGDYLKFQCQEIQELQLAHDEFQTLDLEHRQLAHAGELLQHIDAALRALSDNEECNALKTLHQALQSLETVQQVNPKIATWLESIKSAIIHVSDTEDELRRYLEGVDLDPERLLWLENRISTIFNIARKHKIAPHELLDLQDKLTTELATLANSDAKLAELTSKLDILESQYHVIAKKLSQSRQKYAKKLAQEITQIIHELALQKAEFDIHFEYLGTPQIAAHGLEKIIFQIKTNAGQTLLPLAKIASGGELSRVSLAIHLATAKQHTTPTLIFDEVDVGVGGGTAEIVGKLLRRLGASHQVLCITHQPQVAACGHQHIFVKKAEQDNATNTIIQHLTSEQKINELARMLGGIEITKTTLQHAKEMFVKSNEAIA